MTNREKVDRFNERVKVGDRVHMLGLDGEVTIRLPATLYFTGEALGWIMERAGRQSLWKIVPCPKCPLYNDECGGDEYHWTCQWLYQ